MHVVTFSRCLSPSRCLCLSEFLSLCLLLSLCLSVCLSPLLLSVQSDSTDWGPGFWKDAVFSGHHFRYGWGSLCQRYSAGDSRSVGEGMGVWGGSGPGKSPWGAFLFSSLLLQGQRQLFIVSSPRVFCSPTSCWSPTLWEGNSILLLYARNFYQFLLFF